MSTTSIAAEPLSRADAAWLRMERTTNPMTVTALMLFDAPLDFDRLRAALEERLLLHPRFRRRVVEHLLGLAAPRWEDDSRFDIRGHLHRVALPPPGDDAALRALVSDLMSERLDLARPPWQTHLIEGVGRGCAVLTRVHHCVGDGYALVRILLSMADPIPAPDPAPASPAAPSREPAPAAPSPTPTPPRPRAAPRGPVDLVRDGARVAAALAKLLLLPADAPNPLRGTLGVVRRAAWSKGIPLEEIRRIERAHGATLNDVLSSALAGGLRRWLVARHPLAAPRDVRAIVPVNLRADGCEDPGNRFGLVFLTLPLEHSDPVERLRELARRTRAIKATPEAGVAFAILLAIGAAAPPIEDAVVRIFSRKASLVLTNVPGPTRPLSLAGVPVRSLLFWVPQSGVIGVGASILSYAGEARLGLNADARLVPDPETVVAGFEEEFAALGRSALVGRPSGE